MSSTAPMANSTSRHSDSRMSSSGLTSADQFSYSLSTEGKPLLFRLVEVQKWQKLLRLLNRRKGKVMCRERDTSGLTLLGICLVFKAPLAINECIIKIDPSQCTSKDSFGANPLHMACLNGSAPEAVQLLLNARPHLVIDTDCDFRVPLHHIVECICRDEIAYDQGIMIINMLSSVSLQVIHASDKHSDTPLDIVHMAIIKAESQEENERLTRLYQHLNDMSIKAYLAKKQVWENEANTSVAGKTLGTTSTQSSDSVHSASDFNIALKNGKIEVMKNFSKKRLVSQGTADTPECKDGFRLFGRKKRS